MTALLLAVVLSQVKPLPCRPTVSCIADIVPAGHLEAEVGGQASPGVQTLPVLVKLSVTNWLQLQVGSDALFAAQQGTPTTVVDGAAAAVKVRLLEQGPIAPTISLSARVAAPTRPPLPALQTSLDFNAVAHVSKDLTSFLHADLNAMFNLFGGQPQGQAALALSTGLPVGLGFALEGHSTFGNPARPNDGGLRGVITFSPSNVVVFDVGGDWGFFPQTRA